jgi:YgiT-type zinc finger domain-containing protein
MNTECAICHGALEEKMVTFTAWAEGQLVVIERVPALVCEACGETYYTPEVVDRVQSLIASDAQPDRTVEAAVYQLPA